MSVEEFDELRLVLLADALEVEDFLEVGVGAVADVDEVGLHDGLRGGRAYLEGFEERVDFGHALGYAFEVAGWGGGTGVVDG